MESFTKVRKNHFGFVMNFTGKRKLDGKPICAKQVPKAKIANWDDYDGRRIPREFKLHILASEIEGVVKVTTKIRSKIKLLIRLSSFSSVRQGKTLFSLEKFNFFSFVLIMEKPSNSIDIYEFSQIYGRIDEEPAKIVFEKVEIVYTVSVKIL